MDLLVQRELMLSRMGSEEGKSRTENNTAKASIFGCLAVLLRYTPVQLFRN
jgi:hypothetical protein